MACNRRWCACSWRNMRCVRVSNISAVTATNNQPLKVLIKRIDSTSCTTQITTRSESAIQALANATYSSTIRSGDTSCTRPDGGAA